MNDEECKFCKLLYHKKGHKKGELKVSSGFKKYQIIGNEIIENLENKDKNYKVKNWICVFDKYPLTPRHILIIYKPTLREHSHKSFYEIKDDLDDFYEVLEGCCKLLEDEKVKKEYPHVKLNLFSLNAIGRGVYKGEDYKDEGHPEGYPGGHLHFHIIPEYKPEFYEKLEWHRMYPTRKVDFGFWYFGYREYKRNKEKIEVGYKEKIKKQIEKLRGLMGI